MIYRIVTALGDGYELGEGTGSFGPAVTEIRSQSAAYPAIPCYRIFLSNGSFIDTYLPAEVWENPNLQPDQQPTENLPKST